MVNVLINYEKIDTPDFRTQRADMLVKVLDRYGGLTSMERPAERLAQFRSLGPEGFVQQVTSLNRILVQNHSHEARERDFMPGYDNFIEDYRGDFHAMPAMEDRKPLLKYLYGAARDAALKPNASLDHIAAVVGFGINAVHAFDGTGRTARAAYHLLASPASKREELLKASSKDSHENTVQLSHGAFRDTLFADMKLALGSHREVNGVLQPIVVPYMDDASMQHVLASRTEKEFTMVNHIIRDPNLREIVPFIYIRGVPPEQRGQILQQTQGANVFRLDVFTRIAPQSEMDYLYKITREIRSTFAKKFISMIADKDTKNMIHTRTKERGIITIPMPDLITEMAQKKLSIVDYYS